MENNERDRKLDQWLDQALSEYSSAEPRLGLEQRVLNRVRADEQARARRWNLWRWMPAFGAIAAVIVVAVAVRPIFERKAPVRQINARIEPNSTPREEKLQATDNTSFSKTLAAPKTKSPEPQTTAIAARGIPPPRQELKLNDGDRDRLTATRGTVQSGTLVSPLSDLKKTPSEIPGRVAQTLNAPAPPPPPPSQTLENSVADKNVVVSAPAASSSAAAKQLPPSSETVEVQVPVAIKEGNLTAAESAIVLLGKDAKRKEAHAKAEPEASREDGNVIEAFGVKVRVQGGPAIQQFPTPAPLSKQEKLALAAAQQLKDSAVTQHKSVDIAPIEIKDVEIKPLEGPEK
jgi:hypothetical protein